MKIKEKAKLMVMVLTFAAILFGMGANNASRKERS